MIVECAYCCRIREHNYCSAKHQMLYEYEHGIRDKKEIVKKAHTKKREVTIQRWKEGKPYKYTDKRGYIQVKTPTSWRKEHHLIWSAHNGGVMIPKGYVVHHINQNKTDNRIENLALMPENYHLKLHCYLRKINEQGRFK
jgi:hypothetical protein